MREDQAAAVTRTRRRTPLGIQVLAGLSGLLALLLVSMLVAIVLVVGLRRDQTALSDRGVPYANADEANHAPNENLEVERFFTGIKTGAAMLACLGAT